VAPILILLPYGPFDGSIRSFVRHPNGDGRRTIHARPSKEWIMLHPWLAHPLLDPRRADDTLIHMMRIFLSIAAVAAVSALSSCADPPPPAPFQIFVKVESDPGRPIPGATVSRGDKTLGTTDVQGRALLTMNGAEGEITSISVQCPEGFQTPPKPVGVKLTRLVDKGKVPEYTVSCPPTVRRVVIAVRAENGPSLPVLYLSKPITKTDENGAAHFALAVSPGAQFQVALDTAERKDLKPSNPSKVFVVSERDEVLLFDQKFDVEKKYVPPPPKPYVPKPIRRNDDRF
jgi:hypothetical protein